MSGPPFEKLPIGRSIAALLDVVTERWQEPLRAVSDGVATAIDGAVARIAEVPPALTIAGATLLVGVLRREWRTSLLTLVCLGLAWNLELWTETLETLAMVAAATAVSTSIGVPLGIAAAHRPRLFSWLRPALDWMQTIPTFVFLIPTLMLFGLGTAPGLVSTIVFAMPAPIRFTVLGIQSVPPALLEVGAACGASPWQLLWKIELPHARGALRAGISQCILLALSMVVIAALVGAGGLGKPVVQALNTVNVAKGCEAGFAIVLLAVWLDRLLGGRDGR
jgi:glycine betaine/proline transport system permease protein